MPFKPLLPAVLLASLMCVGVDASAKSKDKSCDEQPVQLGVRPFYLIDDMDEGPLKDKLEVCKTQRFYKTDFSIGHRGAPLQFPEHTDRGHDAATRMGAGIVECDINLTKDRQL